MLFVSRPFMPVFGSVGLRFICVHDGSFCGAARNYVWDLTISTTNGRSSLRRTHFLLRVLLLYAGYFRVRVYVVMWFLSIRGVDSLGGMYGFYVLLEDASRRDSTPQGQYA